MYEELENEVGTVLTCSFRIIPHRHFLERLKIVTSHNVPLLQTGLPTLKFDRAHRFGYLGGDAGKHALGRFLHITFQLIGSERAVKTIMESSRALQDDFYSSLRSY